MCITTTTTIVGNKCTLYNAISYSHTVRYRRKAYYIPKQTAVNVEKHMADMVIMSFLK